MQGDYMRLNYEISGMIQIGNWDKLPKRGYCVVKTDSAGVVIADAVRFQPEKTPLSKDEQLVRYTRAKWSVNIGAESFFFQEGQAEKFEQAKYGGIMVDKDGNSILTGLYDEQLNRIE
jgi:uncharacterized membrane-anchored protein